MAITQLPLPSGGGGGGSAAGFLVDMGDATLTTIALDQSYPSGGYEIALAITDSTFDVYGLDAAGVTVGYTNSGSVVFDDAVETIVIYGSVVNQIYTFTYKGIASDASSIGTAVGAAPFITEVTGVTDLPENGDSTTISGGNFDSDLRVFFRGTDAGDHEAVVTVTSSTTATIIRPDNILTDHAPYDLVLKNNGTPDPVGTNANILPAAITVGVGPVFDDGDKLPGYSAGVAYSHFLGITDPESTVFAFELIAGHLPIGLALTEATGEISGTSNLADTREFTIRVTDGGGNFAEKVFTLGRLGSWVANTPPTGLKNQTYSYTFEGQVPEEINYYSVTNDGSTAWSFEGDLNPTLTVIRGEKYEFLVNASGHPFQVQTASGAYDSLTQYSTGFAGLGSQVGLVEWTVPAGAPDTLYYVCQVHQAMGGTINVIDQPTPAIGSKSYSISSGTLPAGLSINSATGVLSGTPSGFGTSNVTVQCDFAGMGYVDYNFDLAIYDTVTYDLTTTQTWNSPVTTTDAIVMVMGGGGSGGAYTQNSSVGCGGGGGGGANVYTGVSFTQGNNYSVVIGAGASASYNGYGNGNGGASSTMAHDGGTHTGSAGGAGQYPNGGSSIYPGGTGGPSQTGGGGGGGAGAPGNPANATSFVSGYAGSGGAGLFFNGAYYGGGGGGGGCSPVSDGAGGSGGGGYGNYGDGVDNLGGGGGGGAESTYGRRGGSGRVIVIAPIIP